MTEQETDTFKLRISWGELKKDPYFIPLLPRHEIGLFRYDGDGKRFAKLFRETWYQIPLGVRRRLLKHWKQKRESTTDDGAKLKDLLVIPRFELTAGKNDFYRGNAGKAGGFAIANYMHFLESFAFDSRYIDDLSDMAVKSVIAHELVHAWLGNITGWHLDPERNKDDIGYFEAEEEANDFVHLWGFDPELFFDEISRLPEYEF